MDDRVMQFRVGVMVLSTLIIAGILVAMFGSLPSLMQGSYKIRIWFPDAQRVTVGTPIRKSGILIGRVSKVELVEQDDPSGFGEGVIITAEIDSNRNIYSDEVCEVRADLLGDVELIFVPAKANPTQQILTNAQSIGTGGQAAPARTKIEPDATLKGRSSTDPTRMIADLEGRLAGITDTVSQAAKSFSKASDELARAARGISNLLEANEQEISKSLAQVDDTLEAIRLAAENANKVFGDPETQQRLKRSMDQLPMIFERMGRTLDLVETNLRNLDKFTGPLGENAEQRVARIDHALAKLDVMISSTEQFTRDLNNPNGSLGRLIRDPELYNHINRAAANIDEVSRRLKPIVDDVRVLSDKVARHPGVIVRDAVRPGAGIK